MVQDGHWRIRVSHQCPGSVEVQGLHDQGCPLDFFPISERDCHHRSLPLEIGCDLAEQDSSRTGLCKTALTTSMCWSCEPCIWLSSTSCCTWEEGMFSYRVRPYCQNSQKLLREMMCYQVSLWLCWYESFSAFSTAFWQSAEMKYNESYNCNCGSIVQEWRSEHSVIQKPCVPARRFWMNRTYDDTGRYSLLRVTQESQMTLLAHILELCMRKGKIQCFQHSLLPVIRDS